jgi:hypothetical protein
MGAPGSGTKAADQPSAEALLTAFKKIDAAERRRHASVLNYWLSIRGDKEFPPLHDLDPLELSDAGPNSILMELISGGHDAEIRHMGEALRDDDWPERIMDADNPSILSCIAKKLPIVAISRDFLAFEDEFDTGVGPTRCWVTMLPLSAGGAWVDYVYALVSLDGPAAKPAAKPAKSKKAPEPEPGVIDEVEPDLEAIDEPVEEVIEELPEAVAVEEPDPVVDQVEEPVDDVAAPAGLVEDDDDESPEPAASAVAKAAPGFSKLLDSIAGLTGFYGSQPVKVEPVVEDSEETFVEEEAVVEEEPAVEEPVAPHEDIIEEAEQNKPVAEQEPQPAKAKPAPSAAEQPTRASEGSLKNKLADVRTKADEARMAKIRANTALYEGLSAAYDFALDAEETPEEYLKLVEAQGLKIQLRSPMKPVVKLAFDGMCDDMTIKQLEAVLAWAFDEELPRGTLAERLDSAGGIGHILNGAAKAA